MQVPYVTLNDGYRMPFFGLGTYSLKGDEAEAAIEYAIDIGYRHFDTAYLYNNEKEVGNAVRKKINDGTVKREDLFITTKLNLKTHHESIVIVSCKESLRRLGLDYVDLFLIHSPVSLKETDDNEKVLPSDIDYIETWRGMEECKRLGLARSIGVSNFNSEQIERLISAAKIKPVNNQIEVTLNLNQKSLIQFCKNHDITVTGYSPLGKPNKRPHIKDLWQHPKVQDLSKKYNKTPAQISLRFVLQMGAAPIPKSSSKTRIMENFDVFDFNFSDEEMNALQDIGSGDRVVPLNELKDAKYYPFNIA
ncbi:estradiol 17 beta-dehydrogenase 5-like [Copidosoma floridanum]|uniref:estradiol 17 beta-dehydrogenase 5-like n=1 Tax=Copidosoma floridanum TaxID=29053 RepID=UPI0006C971AF|nr:estradiol 17 beta-dehydrogenase 5-like [Copidosoma floridanum]